MSLRSCGFYPTSFSRGDFLHYCGSSGREHRQFIHHHPYPTCDAVTSVRQHSKSPATITCNRYSVYCTVTLLFEDHCMKYTSVTLNRQTRGVTTRCRQAETLLQWARPASKTKIATRLQSKAVNATKLSGMKGEGQGSKGQMSAVNQRVYRKVFSVFTSSSRALSYDLWYVGNTNTAHTQLFGF